MDKRWSNWKDILKRGSYSISFLVVSTIYILINRYTGREKDLSIFIDNLIPFNRYFILVYVFWYLYIVVFLLFFCIHDEKKYYKILIGINTGMIICYFIYLIFPTAISRPVFNHGDDMVGKLFSWLYANDNPCNCFPSIHVMNTIIITLYVQKDKLYINGYIKTFSLISAAAIIYSTLAIRQHVVLDAVSAAFISYGLYTAIEHSRIFAKLRGLQRISGT